MDPASMSSRQALDALADLPRYEERLTAKAAGLTSMVWGLATAGIFLTYLGAADLLERHDAPWANALLWVPWVAAGIGLTGAIWSSHAVSLRRDPQTRKGIAFSLAMTTAFLVVTGVVYSLVALVAGIDWNAYVVMTLANGGFAFALGSFHARRRECGWQATLVAGLAITVAGVGLGLAGLSEPAAGLVGAAVTGTAWFLSGAVTYSQG